MMQCSPCVFCSSKLASDENNLSERLLESNKRQSNVAEKNATALNEATVQLAKSTSGLNRATWVLAIFTGIQVILAIVNFYLSLQPTSHR